jgi:hypothetical protein
VVLRLILDPLCSVHECEALGYLNPAPRVRILRFQKPRGTWVGLAMQKAWNNLESSESSNCSISTSAKSSSIKSSRFMLETCFGLYASVEVSVAELYVWHRVLEW